MWWWWCRPHPVREHAQDLRPPLGARPASPPTRQAAQPPQERLALSIGSSTTSEPTIAALIYMARWVVSIMSVLSSKARLKAAHVINLSYKVSSLLSETSFVLRETVRHERLVCSTKYIFSGHAYSVNLVKQSLMNSPTLKGLTFTSIDSLNLKHNFVASSESI